MTIRTTTKLVTFAKPFVINDQTFPGGSYVIDMDDQILDGVSFQAYRRVLTLLHIKATPAHPGEQRTLVINPKELEALLEEDRRSEEQRNSAGEESIARRAIERGENEGMIISQEYLA